MTHSNRLARFSILFAAAALALTVAVPISTALACGGYGRITEQTRVTWAINAHMNAVSSGDLKTLKAQWPDEGKKTLASWVANHPEKATWKVTFIDVLEDRAAVVKVEVTKGEKEHTLTFTLAKRDGAWTHIARDMSATSRIASK